ncbi:MAG TPA: hypothetical protein VMT43_04260, partial [Acidimicrobiales bacterium]|nr:hypothetical protein [Acidimicrobiales bacterium]
MSRHAEPVTSSRNTVVRRASPLDWLQVAIVLVVLVTVLLWRPLTTRDGFYAPADLSQETAVLRTVPSGQQVGNAALGVLGSEVLPSQLFDAEEVRHGHLPLWNPYEGSGVPQLADGEAAPLSPFNVPYAVFSLRVALVVSVAMVLMASGLFTYGLARHLGAGHLGAMVGAIGFAFAGVNLVWLQSTVSAAAALLPAIAWATLGVVDAHSRPRRVLATVALAAAVGVSLLSGHLAITLYALVGATALAIGRLLVARLSARSILRRVGLLAVGATGGVCLAAIQVLPTLEYLANRSPRGQQPLLLDGRLAGLAAFPFLNGSSFGSNRTGVIPILVPYARVVGVYLGAGLVLLGIVGWLVLLRERRVLAGVLAGLAAMWMVLVFDVAGLGRRVMELPGVDMASALRSIPLWALGMSLLAAHGVDAVQHSLVEGRLARRQAVIDV